MNKLDKIRELKQEVANYNPFSGATSLDIVSDILSIMEEETMDKKVCDELCCGKYETCENACVPRADYFKNNNRAELNKLALSILKESFETDDCYLDVWLANVEMALYDAGFASYADKYYRKEAAKIFMKRAFGVSK